MNKLKKLSLVEIKINKNKGKDSDYEMQKQLEADSDYVKEYLPYQDSKSYHYGIYLSHPHTVIEIARHFHIDNNAIEETAYTSFESYKLDVIIGNKQPNRDGSVMNKEVWYIQGGMYSSKTEFSKRLVERMGLTRPHLRNEKFMLDTYSGQESVFLNNARIKDLASISEWFKLLDHTENHIINISTLNKDNNLYERNLLIPANVVIITSTKPIDKFLADVKNPKERIRFKENIDKLFLVKGENVIEKIYSPEEKQFIPSGNVLPNLGRENLIKDININDRLSVLYK